MTQARSAFAPMSATLVQRVPGRWPVPARTAIGLAPAPADPGSSDLRFFLTAYAGGLAFFLAMLL